MRLLLQRDVLDAGFTLGQLFVDQVKFCETLEDAVREIPGAPVAQWKIKGETAIPTGRYRVAMDMSTRFGRVMLHLLDVPGFDGIRMHGANTALDVEGCIGVGQVRTLNGIRMCKDVLRILETRVALALSKGLEVWIEVK